MEIASVTIKSAQWVHLAYFMPHNMSTRIYWALLLWLDPIFYIQAHWSYQFTHILKGFFSNTILAIRMVYPVPVK